MLGDAYDLLTACDSNGDHEVSIPEFLQHTDEVATNRSAARFVVVSSSLLLRYFDFGSYARQDVGEIFKGLTNRVKRNLSRRDEL